MCKCCSINGSVDTRKTRHSFNLRGVSREYQSSKEFVIGTVNKNQFATSSSYGNVILLQFSVSLEGALEIFASNA